MITLGVTGNLSTGKSEVVKILRKQGAVVFDADRAAHEAVQMGKPVYKAIVKIFGTEYLKKNKQIDRAMLATRVFSYAVDLRKLNTLIHPGVIFECLKMIELNKRKKGFLVMDVPLLFESKMESLAEFTIVVSSTLSNILERSKRKGYSQSLAKKILSTQWSLKKKERLADFVVRNNGTILELEKQVLGVLKQIKGK